jgi:hypothetical protein
MTPEQKTKIEKIATLCNQKSTEYRKSNPRMSEKWSSFGSRAASIKFLGDIGYERFVEFVNSHLDPGNYSEAGTAIAKEILPML